MERHIFFMPIQTVKFTVLLIQFIIFRNCLRNRKINKLKGTNENEDDISIGEIILNQNHYGQIKQHSNKPNDKKNRS